MTQYRAFRAPTQDGGLLFDPPRESLLSLLQANRSHQDAALRSIEFAGHPAADVAAQARSDLLAEAGRYSSEFFDPTRAAGRATGPLIFSGHQPQLFHPGVWLKNFVLGGVARAAGGLGVHLVIDSDLCRDPSVRAPAGALSRPRFTQVPIDQQAEPIPFEERRVVDPSCFASFAERVSDQLRGLVPEPLVGCLWPTALRSLKSDGRLGAALSTARRGLEGEWGGDTLEIPFSSVCDTNSFRLFAIELITNAESFRAAHNGALERYRLAHKLRSPAQPLPDLAERGDWSETPFWIWREDSPRRRPLWTRVRQGVIELSDGADWSETLDHDPALAVERLGDLRRRGLKLRSRALTTTLYARLLLSDLFLHGIGGAKYDQVTDDLSECFFGAPPPPHATLTGTRRLPLPREGGSVGEPAVLIQRLRELRYHPERFVAGADQGAQHWIDIKTHWVHTLKTPANAAERHQQIEEANHALQSAVDRQRRQTQSELEESLRRRRADAVLDSREYSFCLFPEEPLRAWLLAASRF